MDKVELQNDIKFRYICSAFATNYWNYDFEIYGNVIKLNSQKKGIYTLIDEYYNVIGVYTDELSLKHQTKEELTDKIAKIYIKYSSNVNKNGQYILPSIFGGFSLKDIQCLSNRIEILPTNHGHSTDMTINFQKVDRIDEDDVSKVCFYYLAYISFLGSYLKQYFQKSFHMKSLGFDYPDVYDYLNNLVSNIEKGIENIDRSPVADISVSIGETGRKFLDEYSNVLYQIIHFYTDNYDVDISNYDFFNILEVPYEIAEERIKGMRNFVYPGDIKLLDIIKPKSSYSLKKKINNKHDLS